MTSWMESMQGVNASKSPEGKNTLSKSVRDFCIKNGISMGFSNKQYRVSQILTGFFTHPLVNLEMVYVDEWPSG